MNTSLVTLTNTLGATESVLEAFVALRDACSEDDYEALHEATLLGTLLNALADLEEAAE